MPTSLRAPATSFPCTVMLPDVFGIRPAISRSRVDFPHPLGPTIEMNSPLLTVNDAPSRATTSPPKTFSIRRSEEHTSELQSLMRISYAVFCLKKKKTHNSINKNRTHQNKQ